jgi:hypothetical protein
MRAEIQSLRRELNVRAVGCLLLCARTCTALISCVRTHTTYHARSQAAREADAARQRELSELKHALDEQRALVTALQVRRMCQRCARLWCAIGHVRALRRAARQLAPSPTSRRSSPRRRLCRPW